MNKLILTPTTKRNILWLFASLTVIYLMFNLFTYFELLYLLEDSIDSRIKHELEHISLAIEFYNDSLFIKNSDEFQESDLVEVTQTTFFLKVYNSKGKLLIKVRIQKRLPIITLPYLMPMKIITLLRIMIFLIKNCGLVFIV